MGKYGVSQDLIACIAGTFSFFGMKQISRSSKKGAINKGQHIKITSHEEGYVGTWSKLGTITIL